ncbi:DUF2325 domain-containing protein [Thioalkalicoccus limnaeus]|uniref:DUF2325 domain-containing protein n=1 Tax=Thioalkalicoccus limnaeus TaxID=120681 RepID=A0ABV4BII4_9GAMM
MTQRARVSIHAAPQPAAPTETALLNGSPSLLASGGFPDTREQPAPDRFGGEAPLDTPLFNRRRPNPAAVTEAATVAKKSGPIKLWDIPHKYHCPIVGTCLLVDELRRISDKVEAGAHRSANDYRIHVRFVGAAETKNPLSIATQRLLDRKFASSIRQFARAKGSDEIEALWRGAVAEGNIPGPFWALMSHPRADHRVKAIAYEDVHMLSHQVGAGLQAEAKALAEARARLDQVERDRQAEKRRLERQLADRDRELAALREELDLAAARQRQPACVEPPQRPDRDQESTARVRAAALEARITDLDRNLERMTRENRRLARQVQDLSNENHALTANLAEQQAAKEALERLLSRAGASSEGLPGCAGSGECAKCVDLGGRRILCIGGRGTLADHYRDLVARYNGELVRHDGGLEDSHRRLEAMMAAADAVVCPADFVSHNAYQRAKRFCKRHAKPCILLRSSGIANFARALEQLAA